MSELLKIYSSREEIDTDEYACWLEINLSNLKNNIESIKSIISDKLDIICVVKANAYGLGSVGISKYLSSIGIKYFAVATIDEALELRNEGGIKEEILILSWTPPSQKETLIKYNLTQTLVDYDYAEKLNELPGIVKCHLKIDTGMNRFGQNMDDIENIKKTYKFKNLKIEGIFSHLCRVREFGEEPDNYTKMQIKNFDAIIEELEKNGINVGLKHIMNSFGILRFNDKKYDLVRPGLLMYGVTPDPNNKEIDKLLEENHFKPVASLKCRVISVKIVEKGDKICFKKEFIANEKFKVALISVGFADGVYFSNPECELRVIIKGYLCPVLGNSFMDHSIVKIPFDSDIEEGDTATIFGYADNSGKHMNHKEFLIKGGSPIGETLSRLTQRITRIFHL